MNWIDAEMKAVRDTNYPDPDAWLNCYPSTLLPGNARAGECDHRWRVVPNYTPKHMRGFFSLPMKTICSRGCGAEA